MMKLPTLRIMPATEKRTVVTPRRKKNAELRTREYLTEAEIDRMIAATKSNRWAHRDGTMILVAYRHGLRVSELVDLRWDQIDFNHATLHVRRASAARLPTIRCRATRCGACGSCNANRIQSQHSSSLRNAARRSLHRALPSLSSALVSWPAWASLLTRTCFGTPVALRWRTRATIRGRCKPILAIAASSTLSDIRKYRRRGSRIFGDS
jgi:Phage integrase family